MIKAMLVKTKGDKGTIIKTETKDFDSKIVEEFSKKYPEDKGKQGEYIGEFILRTLEHFDTIKKPDYSLQGQPFDRLGKKQGAWYIVEIKACLKTLGYVPGRTQKHRMREILEQISDVKPALLQINKAKAQYKIRYDKEVMELIKPSPRDPLPIDRIVYWVKKATFKDSQNLVSDIDEIVQNTVKFATYSKSKATATERKFYKERIRFGDIFVHLNIDGEDIFCPGRFAGYKDNDLKIHKALFQKHGTHTAQRINSILGPNYLNNELENKYKKVCVNVGITPSGNKRRYWPTIQINKIRNVNP